MAVPSVSGLNLVRSFSGVAGTGAVPAAVTVVDILQTPAGGRQNNLSPTAFRGFAAPLTSAVDLSASGLFLVARMAVQARTAGSNFKLLANNDGVFFGVLTNTSNYIQFLWDGRDASDAATVGEATAANSVLSIFPLDNIVPNSSEIGTFNPASVGSFGCWWKQDENRAALVFVVSIHSSTGLVIVEGDSGNNATIGSAITYLASTFTGGTQNLIFTQLGYPQIIYCGIPIKFGNGSSALYSVVIAEQIINFQVTNKSEQYTGTYKYARIQLPDNILGIEFNLAASNNLQRSFTTYRGTYKWFLKVNAASSSSATLKFTSCNFVNAGTIDIRAPFQAISSSFIGCDSVNLSTVTLTNTVITSTTGSYAALATTTAIVSGSTLLNNAIALQITSLGTYSNLGFAVSGNTVGVDITSAVGTGAINLSACTFSGNTTDIRYGGAGTVTVTVGQTGLTTSTTGGGTIVLVTPQPAIAFTGIPTGTEVRALQGSSTLDYVANVTSGTYSYTYSFPVGEKIRFHFNNPGYLQIASDITLSGVNQSIPLSFEPDPSYIP